MTNKEFNMARRITIEPITRLEGHGKIEIFLDKNGNVDNAFLQIPEFRGFEKFCEGRPAEEMPRITTRICGVCPTAHHMASVKALDDLYKVEPPCSAKKIRELMHSIFMLEDHTLHFFFLGGPDLIVGPDAPAGERNILGVIRKLGLENGSKVIKLRKECREIMSVICGNASHPVCGLPGGISKPLAEEHRMRIKETAKYAVEFSQFALEVFSNMVLKNTDYVNLITGDIYYHQTYYMGLVDDKNKVNFYDGQIRIVDPEGSEFAKFPAEDYIKHISEHVEPWTYIKFPFLKRVGWKGFTDGPNSGVYRVAPLARLNASDGMATPLAQGEYQRMYETLGGKPAHSTLAFHWARLIESLYAAERMVELAEDPELTDTNVRNLPNGTPDEGTGVVEAPRGTLFHHYRTDEKGLIKQANLIVGTQNNSAAISMSIAKAAKELIKGGYVTEGLLNKVEMAFRAYDPCLACATHTLPGKTSFIISIFDSDGKLVKEVGLT